jgi:hypothetical protein
MKKRLNEVTIVGLTVFLNQCCHGFGNHGLVKNLPRQRVEESKDLLGHHEKRREWRAAIRMSEAR